MKLVSKSTRAGWLFLLFLAYYASRCVSRGKIHYDGGSPKVLKLLRQCRQVLTSWYFPNPLISNALVQSALAEHVRPEATGLEFTRELLPTRDGGTICLSWASLTTDKVELKPDAPVLFILPGTNGDELGGWYLKLASKYALLEQGYHVVVYVRRGCGGVPMSNGRPQDYADPLKPNSQSDIALAISHVRERHPDSKMLAMGYSLGGNFLANFLGNGHGPHPFTAAVCICSPYDVTGLSYWIEHRYRLVDWVLRKAKADVLRQNRSAIENDLETMSRGVDVDRICAANSFRMQCELDNLAVWGLAGETLNQYLDRSSCFNQLGRIDIPTLFINSIDDPVTHDLFIPYDRLKANPNLVLHSNG
ncbi:hypothetical protein BASA81_015750 [Batrachochytrium salamandrivorans]|nr:hypothetical protein BASA81_015750 [Batrachochytrium salamandrivorans]